MYVRYIDSDEDYLLKGVFRFACSLPACARVPVAHRPETFNE